MSRSGLWLVVSLALSAQAGPPVERFIATALDRADAQVRTSIEIDVQRWSDDVEGDQLAAAFRRSGIEAVVQELKRHRSAGELRSIGGLSRTIRYAHEMRFTGGSRAFLLLADPFATDDLFRGTTTPRGDLVAITIWLGQSGEGEGQIGAGIQLGIDAFGALTVDAKDPLIVLPAVARPRP